MTPWPIRCRSMMQTHKATRGTLFKYIKAVKNASEGCVSDESSHAEDLRLDEMLPDRWAAAHPEAVCQDRAILIQFSHVPDVWRTVAQV